jgi:hypothetical protein
MFKLLGFLNLGLCTNSKKKELIHVEKSCEIVLNENEIAMEEKDGGEKFERFWTLLSSLSKMMKHCI